MVAQLGPRDWYIKKQKLLYNADNYIGRKKCHYMLYVNIYTFRLGCTWKITSGHQYTLVQHSGGNKNMCPIVPVCDLPIVWYLRTAKLHLIIAI